MHVNCANRRRQIRQIHKNNSFDEGTCLHAYLHVCLHYSTCLPLLHSIIQQLHMPPHGPSLQWRPASDRHTENDLHGMQVGRATTHRHAGRASKSCHAQHLILSVIPRMIQHKQHQFAAATTAVTVAKAIAIATATTMAQPPRLAPQPVTTHAAEDRLPRSPR